MSSYPETSLGGRIRRTPMKIHLKHTASDRLALCKIWPEENWVLTEFAHQQAPNTTCKVCAIVAARPDEQDRSEPLPHPDCVQRINNAGAKVAATRHQMTNAHNRLTD